MQQPNGPPPGGLKYSSAAVLEFPSLMQIVRGYASSEAGQAYVAALEPSTDREWIARQQQLTSEIRGYLAAGGSFDFSGLFDAQELLDKSRIQGAALATEDLRDILLIVDRAAQWRNVVLQPPVSMNSAWPAVEELTAGVSDFSDLLKFFGHKIAPDGTLDDHASPELAALRREMEKQKRHIQSSLQVFLRKLSEGGATQDEVIAIRGERFVIPVKTEQRRRVSGVIHGASSSGQTVFIEPLETIEQNNELVRMLEDEQAEIHRILVQMTERVGREAVAIARASGVLLELELQFAKAHFANDYGCSPAEITNAGLLLENARHPVLERNLRRKQIAIIPISLSMTGEQRQLIISGPNTGGKTVCLKTVGLLALMAQAGIPVPAERAQFPVFDAVLADIGDYQSIEQNLSTFSAHVTNIDLISRTATRDSLVVLDELGSATDPEEGAALAVSIAAHFRSRDSRTIISTHLTALKVYAANVDGVLNASLGFDEKTMQPTYALRLGVPGASAGINIAQRLGLNQEIIDAARARMGTQTREISTFLDRLHEEVTQLSQQKLTLSRAQKETETEKHRLQSEGMTEQRAKVRELEKKLEALLRDFEYQAREAVGAVQERAAAQKLSKDAERRIAKLRREFKEQFNSSVVAHHTGADVGDENARPHEVKHIQVGDTVKLKSLGRNARVVRKIDEAMLEVEMGAMKMRVPREDIAEIVGGRNFQEKPAFTPVQSARARGISVSLAEGEGQAASEIHVIGQNVEEATDNVEKFIDRAFLAGHSQVRVVHGSGMGILRKALRQFLKTHPHVNKVSEPPHHEGGAGATVVELKQ